MKIIIACAGSKSKSKGYLRGPDGRQVNFVAEPSEAPGGKTEGRTCHRPDDPVRKNQTWRDLVRERNESKTDKDRLLPASRLYRPNLHPTVYQRLSDLNGPEETFILSAGWGIVRSTYLLPAYDVTFSTQAKRKPWVIRDPKDPDWKDFNHLEESGLRAGEKVHFFGGKDYIPTLLALTSGLDIHLIVHYSGKPPRLPDRVIRREADETGRDWYYRAAIRVAEARSKKV